MSGYKPLAAALLLAAASLPAHAQQPTPPKEPVRDEFFWLGEINKASTVINAEQGLLDRALAPKLAQGIAKVIEAGNQPGARRPSTVITFEPLMIKEAGVEVTLIHAGRSSQDMHATYRAAIMRERLLTLADQLNRATRTMVELAATHRDTVVPNYTNGVAAQPNSYGHYLLGLAAGLDRDAQRIRETYARVDRSPMGTTVLNGTSWPLDRQRMADYLGFAALVDNAYDASQIAAADLPIEVGGIVTGIALHVGGFIEDVMTQYAQSRPWIILREGGGNTYVSSAMPQKRNPGLLNGTRESASTALSLAMGPVFRAHNIPPGMPDAKDAKANSAMTDSATRALQGLERILKALAIDPERALEELNSDWTASQELADVLMRKYRLPFRAGHHFASEVVDYAKLHNIKPTEFPYAQAQAIYRKAAAEMGLAAAELPMNEAEFRSTLDPVAIIRNRATSGGPQPAEMDRMLAEAKQRLDRQDTWIKDRREKIAAALAKLDADFGALAKSAN
ncbi:MAG: argininosuccinate lyase [Bosea sp.]|uniref:argininosuccinate lyase n=1 Tax=Bosea sp. (in: a-proteobacteria) TaxID=1871050 RepID=UPI001AC22FE3|nr:argininosuccinate lyase [Bosea sp. (in: a-proteobacteria)]MBN9451921.1 argininosuccinate lyase [Bosea sp. (in: a-proteobacteria)]